MGFLTAFFHIEVFSAIDPVPRNFSPKNDYLLKKADLLTTPFFCLFLLMCRPVSSSYQESIKFFFKLSMSLTKYDNKNVNTSLATKDCNLKN